MKPLVALARATTPTGEELILYRRQDVYFLRVDGLELMSSRAHGSEESLAQLVCERIAGRHKPTVLLGGLGFGYTLRAALDDLPGDARVVVCELFEMLVDWNRGPLGSLAGRPLDDPRVEVLRRDVWQALQSRAAFDAIVLDVDNGPWAFTVPANARLYSRSGLERIRRCLAPGGLLAVWSCDPSPEFEGRLARAGFAVEAVETAARPGGKGPRHTIFLAAKHRSD